MSRTPRSARARALVAVAVLAVVAVLGGAVAPWAYASFVDTTAKDRIEADPPPALFGDSAIALLEKEVAAQRPTAEHLLAAWFARHGAHRDDAAFAAWLERTLPGPPPAAQRDAEIRQVQKIFPTRTPQGVTAASWLEAHGKKDVWKLAAHDQAEMLSPHDGDAVKNDVDAMLTMSKDVADALGARYRQSAPYVVHPYLRTDHVVARGAVCPCSYPSRHATSAAAAETYLGHLSPHRDADYRWTQAEIAWSRVYMAGHVPSDITGGTLLGDMVGEYFLVSRGHEALPGS